MLFLYYIKNVDMLNEFNLRKIMLNGATESGDHIRIYINTRLSGIIPNLNRKHQLCEFYKVNTLLGSIFIIEILNKNEVETHYSKFYDILCERNHDYYMMHLKNEFYKFVRSLRITNINRINLKSNKLLFESNPNDFKFLLNQSEIYFVICTKLDHIEKWKEVLMNPLIIQSSIELLSYTYEMLLKNNVIITINTLITKNLKKIMSNVVLSKDIIDQLHRDFRIEDKAVFPLLQNYQNIIIDNINDLHKYHINCIDPFIKNIKSNTVILADNHQTNISAYSMIQNLFDSFKELKKNTFKLRLSLNEKLEAAKNITIHVDNVNANYIKKYVWIETLKIEPMCFKVMDSECCVCYENMNKKNAILLNCSHQICIQCIHQIIDKQCPLCRNRIETKHMNPCNEFHVRQINFIRENIKIDWTEDIEVVQYNEHLRIEKNDKKIEKVVIYISIHERNPNKNNFYKINLIL